MGSAKEPIGEMIIKQALGGEEFISQNPTVLSCGGIYIPRKPEYNPLAYHILTTSSRSEPVKVVTGVRPKNFLHEILLKESMN